MNADHKIEALLSRAALLRLLALGLRYLGPGHQQRMLDDIARLRANGRANDVLLGAFAEALAGIQDTPLAEAYSRLFIGQDALLLHETAYSGGGRDHGLADVNGFYLAFGFDLTGRERELPDHLAVELEFLSLLLVKQAYALTECWDDQYAIAHDAARKFLRDHLGRWVATVGARLHERAPADAYRTLFAAIEDAVRRECNAFDIEPAPLRAAPPDDMQGATFVCPLEPPVSELSVRALD